MNSQQRTRFAEALQRVAGDEETLSVLATIAIEDAPELLDQMDQSLAGEDLESASRAAHTLKGMLGTFETNRPVSELQPFIEACRGKELGEARALHSKLSSELHTLLDEISAVAQ